MTLRRDVDEFVAQAVAFLGGLDIVIANAGGGPPAGSIDATDDVWEQILSLNLMHAVRLARASLPHLKTSGSGTILLIASISGSKTGSRAPYAVAKAAEIMLARSLADEAGAHGVRVNALSPGSIWFPGGAWDRFRDQYPARFERFSREEFPAGRLGTPEEVADVATFLVSGRAGWIHGANIPVDGGQRAATAR